MQLEQEADIFDSPMPPLEADAKALLEEQGGDIEKARMSYIGYMLAYIKDEMPELYEQIKINPKGAEPHAALVEVTWDAIAAYMPVTHNPRPLPEAARRLTAIARCSLPAGGPPTDTKVLDVGCGNGLLYPFLSESRLPSSNYRGIDLSSRMIALAEHAHGGMGAVFEDSSFAAECERGNKYDSIIFNGVLQFFDDQPATLKAAAALLSDAEDARIVVSHLSGASFVRRELDDNPTTVLNTMPSLQMMEDIAASLGMQVVIPSFLGSDVEAINKNLETFFLAVFRRRSADDEDDDTTVADLGTTLGALELPDMFVDVSQRLN